MRARPDESDTATEVTTAICARVVDIELSEPVADLQRTAADGRRAERAWALVRLRGEPLGLDVLEIPAAGLSSAALTENLVQRHRPRIAQCLGLNGGHDSASTLRDAILAGAGTAFTRAHEEFAPRAPRCSVVVCTRDRPNDLRRCLASLTRQDHPAFAVWVVDNAPADDETRQVVMSFAAEMDIHYVVEPRPGLSRARNAALENDLDGEFVAWLDDDEVADPFWLTELMRAFDGDPEVAAASGVVAPAELDTKEQLWFEQFGGHSKGRGFVPDRFSPQTRDRQHPLYPLPPFGVGANMAFRTEVLRRRGGFDEALGAGTPAKGSEDTKIFSDVLRAGDSVAYWPTAVTWHYHRRDLDGLRRQLYGYGSGLTAFYLAAVLRRPSTALELAALAPRALRDLYSPGSLRVATLEDDFPRELLAQNRRGMVAGPWLYLLGATQGWRMKRRSRQPKRGGQ